MPLVGSIERRFREIEGFRVSLCYPDGSDVRSDKELPGTLPSYQRQAANTATVEEWKANRFRSAYVGYDVRVLLKDGTPAHGRTLLQTVRASYA